MPVSSVCLPSHGLCYFNCLCMLRFYISWSPADPMSGWPVPRSHSTEVVQRLDQYRWRLLTGASLSCLSLNVGWQDDWPSHAGSNTLHCTPIAHAIRHDPGMCMHRGSAGPRMRGPRVQDMIGARGASAGLRASSHQAPSQVSSPQPCPPLHDCPSTYKSAPAGTSGNWAAA